MSDPTPATVPATIPVNFTIQEALQLLEGVGSVLVAFNPATAAPVAAITGLGALINRLVPAIRQLHDTELSIAQQQALADKAAALRAEVGAAPAAAN